MSSPIWKLRRSRFRAFYTVTGLAKLAGVSRQEMRHTLKSLHHLAPRYHGAKLVYYLRDVREAYPDLYESIRLKLDLDEEQPLYA